MKTVFITAFEGVEAKNILRTDILRTLLSSSEIRVILLMKNEERAEAYKKQFSDPRIFYEVVPYSRSMGKGLDRFFAWLKFVLLRTKSTALQRRLVFESKKDFFSYYFMNLLNAAVARPIVRTAVRYLDFKLVQNSQYCEVFDKYEPDLVFMAHLFEETEINLLREAKHRNIKTIGFINSWDKITMRCVMRLLPDQFVVFNDIAKDELVKYHDADPSRVFVGGIPQYDFYFNGNVSTRGDFFKKIGIDPAKKLIVYAPIGTHFSGSDMDFSERLWKLCEEGKLGKNAEVLIRFNPRDYVDAEELKKRPYLIYDYPGKRYTKQKRGSDWDMDFQEIQHLKDTLSYASLLICHATSLSIEAAILQKPVININYEIKLEDPTKSATRLYKMEHYDKAIASGGIRLVNNEAELIDWARRYLENPDTDSAGRNKLAEQQCGYLGGRSGERIGKFIIDILGG